MPGVHVATSAGLARGARIAPQDDIPDWVLSLHSGKIMELLSPLNDLNGFVYPLVAVGGHSGHHLGRNTARYHNRVFPEQVAFVVDTVFSQDMLRGHGRCPDHRINAFKIVIRFIVGAPVLNQNFRQGGGIMTRSVLSFGFF